MARSTRPAIAVALLLAGLVVGLLVPRYRLGDASNYLLMADSLWVDGDLAYTQEDLTRAQALAFADHPRGIFLMKHAAGYAYAKPPLYPAVAVPFYALFGPAGFFALNGVLLAALVLLGADILAHRLTWPTALLASTVVLAASVTPAYVYWIDPFLLACTLVAGAVAAFRRGAAATSAALLTAVASMRPPYLALALAPLLLLVSERRWTALARFALGGIVAALLLLTINRVSCGQWSPYSGQRLFFFAKLPFLVPDAESASFPAAVVPAGGVLPDITALPRTAVEFLVGRFGGVLIYFPSLLACALWARRWDREKRAWLLGLIAGCAALIIVFPHNTMGGNQALGNRLFALLPVGLVFVDVLAWSVWRALATAALLLIALPVARAPLALSLDPGAQIADVPYRFLPLEWSQAARLSFPFQYPQGMSGLTDVQFQWDGEGVWTRGGERAEFVFVRFKDEPPPRVGIWSREPAIELADGGVPLVLDWQPGLHLEIELTHPVAQYADESFNGVRVRVYSLRAATATGTAGRDLGGAADDDRQLGIFVRPIAMAAPIATPAQ